MNRSFFRAPWLPATLLFLQACLGWLLLWPATRLTPRDRNLVVLFGRDGGKFSDNCKHFFAALHAAPPAGKRVIYLCIDRALRERIRALGAQAELAGSARGLWLLLRAGTIIVDSIDWALRGRIAATRGARIVQLWHGIPLKQVQIPLFETRLRYLPRFAGWLLRFQRAVIGRFAPTDWMLSTSRFITDRAFASSFRYKHVSHAGYPRNDALFGSVGALTELGTDARAIAAIGDFRAGRPAGRVVLYAPTFRDGFGDPFCGDQLNADAFAAISQRLGILLLVKLHPWMHGRADVADRPGLFFVSPESDIYPVLRDIDILVTDYSSIFFDFLLLDRPVAFFPYDLEHYLASERPMYFDYEAMTPGLKARTLTELETILARILTQGDDRVEDRRRVRELVFDHRDGAAGARLAAELFDA